MADKLFTQAEVDNMIAAAASTAEASVATATEAASKAERARISAITGSDLFKGREAAAQKMIEKGMSSDDALDLLATIPVEKSADEGARDQNNATAEKALDLLATENPDIKPDASAPAAAAKGDTRTADAVATARAYNAARKGLK